MFFSPLMLVIMLEYNLPPTYERVGWTLEVYKFWSFCSSVYVNDWTLGSSFWHDRSNLYSRVFVEDKCNIQHCHRDQIAMVVFWSTFAYICWSRRLPVGYLRSITANIGYFSVEKLVGYVSIVYFWGLKHTICCLASQLL